MKGHAVTLIVERDAHALRGIVEDGASKQAKLDSGSLACLFLFESVSLCLVVAKRNTVNPHWWGGGPGKERTHPIGSLSPWRNAQSCEPKSDLGRVDLA